MQEIAQPLLRWFDENKRSLPFRAHKTPYRVWVSEVMLQQTRVAAVLPYYERFMRELPTVQALAACPPEKLTKTQRKLWDYMRLHPEVTEFSTIAKRTGLARNTVKKHYKVIVNMLKRNISLEVED